MTIRRVKRARAGKLKEPAPKNPSNSKRSPPRDQPDAGQKKAKAITPETGPERRKQYRYVREGTGGTFTMDSSLPHIGTDTCNTCLGVYLAIDEHRCFVTHINIDVCRENNEAPHVLKDYEINTRMENAIVWWVKSKLTRQAFEENWGPITQRMRDSLIMVCPKSETCDVRYTGDAAVVAVKEFLGIDDPGIHPSKDCGFVVTHTGGPDSQVEYFQSTFNSKGVWTGSTSKAGWDEIREPDAQPKDAVVENGDIAVYTTDWAWNGLNRTGEVRVEEEQETWEGPYPAL